MPTNIAILNKSASLLKNQNAQVSLMAQACNTQILRQVCPAWGMLAQGNVQFFTDERLVPSGYAPIYILDNPDEPDALGYHTEDGSGKPWGRIFVKPILDYGGTVLSGSLSVSSVLSHEVIELWADPCCNKWADAADGNSYAWELCDPVESDAYTIAVGRSVVSVSNFVTPAWFDQNPPVGRSFDFLHNLTAPFTMDSGGYVIYREAGEEQIAFGANYPTWKKTLKQSKTARFKKRDRLASRGAQGRRGVVPDPVQPHDLVLLAPLGHRLYLDRRVALRVLEQPDDDAPLIFPFPHEYVVADLERFGAGPQVADGQTLGEGVHQLFALSASTALYQARSKDRLFMYRNMSSIARLYTSDLPKWLDRTIS